MIVYSVSLIIIFSFTTSIFSQVQFTPHIITTNTNHPQSVFAIDVDSDDDVDVLSAGLGIAWYENDGNEIFTTHLIMDLQGGPDHVFAIDVDSDSDMDVVASYFEIDPFDCEIFWYENDGNENFTTHAIGGCAQYIYVIDLDSDEDIDVITTFHYDNYYNYVEWYDPIQLLQI
jgi:hypothetical protein